jgi:NAD(P)-dependent dehydrogenase (short-subunit alcohol dehydrogenase family)
MERSMLTVAAADRVLWVVGASSGIGRAAALAAARTGRTVVVSGRRADQLAALAADVEAAGGRATDLAGDVTADGWAIATRAAIVPCCLVWRSRRNAKERPWNWICTTGWSS